MAAKGRAKSFLPTSQQVQEGDELRETADALERLGLSEELLRGVGAADPDEHRADVGLAQEADEVLDGLWGFVGKEFHFESALACFKNCDHLLVAFLGLGCSLVLLFSLFLLLLSLFGGFVAFCGLLTL